MFNKVFLLGYLGKDPEISFVNNEKPVANFTLATNEFYKGETVTQWHRVVAWNRIAENCAKFLSKGSQVLIEGRIQYESWVDPEGNTKTATKIIANRVQFIRSPNKEDKQSIEQQAQQHSNFDDIPF